MACYEFIASCPFPIQNHNSDKKKKNPTVFASKSIQLQAHMFSFPQRNISSPKRHSQKLNFLSSKYNI